MTNQITTTIDAKVVAPTRGVLSPLGIQNVTLSDGYWHDRQALNASVSIEHCESWIARVGWVDNFDMAAGGQPTDSRTGPKFADSEVYKLIEGMSWEVGRTGDTVMNTRLEALIERVARAQEADGYINTCYGRPGQEQRYSDLEHGHELYCYGHLIQAAVARGRTHGDDLLVEVAKRAADHICETFGPVGLQRVCGHPEVEVALVELARYTGNPKYLHQAKLFIERRGTGSLHESEFPPEHYQDDVPVREASVFRGHAVRALYLAAGAVDVAVDDGDDDLLQALIDQTSNTVARRTHITGGMGSRHTGESFGLDFELAPDRSYSETCASIGSMMLNFRLLLATGDPRYSDLIERTMFNVFSAGVSADGTKFFYINTLHQRSEGAEPSSDAPNTRAASSMRAPWFAVSCCPTNVVRTVASLATYFATTTSNGIQIHQYATMDVRTELTGGNAAVKVSTDYPRTGRVELEVIASPSEEWTLELRVPAWATSGATLETEGQKTSVEPGTVSLTRAFDPGDVIVLDLPMAPTWVTPDRRIDALRGTVAVERGPLVYCLESVDLQNQSVNDICVDTSVPLADSHSGGVDVSLLSLRHSAHGWPYKTGDTRLEKSGRRTATLFPYSTWGNRGPSTMRVWLPLAL